MPSFESLVIPSEERDVVLLVVADKVLPLGDCDRAFLQREIVMSVQAGVGHLVGEHPSPELHVHPSANLDRDRVSQRLGSAERMAVGGRHGMPWDPSPLWPT